MAGSEYSKQHQHEQDEDEDNHAVQIYYFLLTGWVILPEASSIFLNKSK